MDNLNKQTIEKIYIQWDEYAKTRQVDKLIELYAVDAIFESPLVPVILDKKTGTLVGRDEILQFLRIGTEKRPNELVRWYRNGKYFTDGHTLIWEYPRQALDGQQIDIVELMEINDEDRISYHRIYWGWFGMEMLLKSKQK